MNIAPSKFRNSITEVDGIKFHSKLEARYYSNLKLLERAGEVHNVELQKPYALTINGQLIATYRADFVFFCAREKRVKVVDVKGCRTREYIMKKKMMKAIHNIEIEEVGK